MGDPLPAAVTTRDLVNPVIPVSGPTVVALRLVDGEVNFGREEHLELIRRSVVDNDEVLHPQVAVVLEQ